MTALITVVALLIASLFFFILLPFFLWAPAHESATQRWLRYQKLYQEKQRLLEHLKDIELDHQLDKLNDQDHDGLRQSSLLELTKLYQEIEDFEKSDPVLLRIEKDMKNLRS